MAEKILPEAQAVSYANKRYAYTDAATETDYYLVDDAAPVATGGNIAGQLSAWLNKTSGSAAATAASGAATTKTIGKTMLTVALIIAAIVVAGMLYKKFIK